MALQLRFFKVESVLAADGRMTLKVWMRTSWTDERLRWNPDEWGGVTQLHFLGASLPAGAEVTEIWLPDVQPCEWPPVEPGSHTDLRIRLTPC